jgi:hypothetical protein
MLKQKQLPLKEFHKFGHCIISNFKSTMSNLRTCNK